MRKMLYIFLLLFSSCNLVTSTEDSLTKEAWYLYSEQNSIDGKFIYYNIDDTPFVLKFNKNGTLDVTENGIKKAGLMSWEFSEVKGMLKVYYRNKHGNWYYDLNSEKLTITDFDDNLNSTVRFYYKKDGPWKDKREVELLNTMNQNTSFK